MFPSCPPARDVSRRRPAWQECIVCLAWDGLQGRPPWGTSPTLLLPSQVWGPCFEMFPWEGLGERLAVTKGSSEAGSAWTALQCH